MDGAEPPAEDARGHDEQDRAQVEEHGLRGGFWRGPGRGAKDFAVGIAVQRRRGGEVGAVDGEEALAEGGLRVRGAASVVCVGDARGCAVAVTVYMAVGDDAGIGDAVALAAV